MNKKKIEISEEIFNRLAYMSEGKGYVFKDGCDLIGFIKQGAVCCDLVLREDKSFSGEDYCYDGKYVIDATFYLLGKDTGYGEQNGVPYDCVKGFYSKAIVTKNVPGTHSVFKKCVTTYEEFIENLCKEFDENLNNELIAGTNETELTWEKVEKS